jgi:pilus assembly protein CpaF
MFRLSLQTEGQEPKKFTFDQDEVTIGREPTSDIHLGTSNVSKRHARIVRREGRYFIVDRKSTNGSFVNGARVSTPQVLKSGDRIFIGDYVMIFDLDETKPQRSDTKIEGDKKEENTDVLAKKPAPSAPPPLPKKPEFAPTAKKPSIELSAEEIPDKEPPMSPEMANKLGPTRYMPRLKWKTSAPKLRLRRSSRRLRRFRLRPRCLPNANRRGSPDCARAQSRARAGSPSPAGARTRKIRSQRAELPAVDVYNAELAAKLFLTVIDKPALSENEDLLSFDFDSEENAKAVEEALATAAQELKLSPSEIDAVKAHVVSELLKFGPVSAFLADDNVKEIFATSRGDLFVYRDGAAMERRSGFSCHDALLVAMGRLASLGGGALEDVENEPFSVYAADKLAAKIYIAADGAIRGCALLNIRALKTRWQKWTPKRRKR